MAELLRIVLSFILHRKVFRLKDHKLVLLAFKFYVCVVGQDLECATFEVDILISLIMY